MRPETKQVIHSKRPIADSDLMGSASSLSGPQLLPLPSECSNMKAGENNKSMPISVGLLQSTSSVTNSESVGGAKSSHTNNTMSPHTATIVSPHSASKAPHIITKPSDTSATTTQSPHTTIESPYTRRDSSSFLSTQEKMELSSWGLPEPVLEVNCLSLLVCLIVTLYIVPNSIAYNYGLACAFCIVVLFNLLWVNAVVEW